MRMPDDLIPERGAQRQRLPNLPPTPLTPFRPNARYAAQPRWTICGYGVTRRLLLGGGAVGLALIIGMFAVITVMGVAVSLPGDPSPPPQPPARPPSPPRSPEPPGRPPNRAGWRYIADANYRTNSNHQNVIDACGEGDIGRPTELCIDASDANTSAGVRCCSDDPDVPSRSSCCTSFACVNPPCACAESGDGYARCLQVSTATEAEARCAALGRRLCSLDEVRALKAASSGCLLDFSYIFTSTPC